MKNTPLHQIKGLAYFGLVFGSFLWAATTSHATQLINFGFNEGTGTSITDSASGLTGVFGAQQDPATDYVQLTSNSPTGQPGDGSITTFGGGFLVADDSTNQILEITAGPIT